MSAMIVASRPIDVQRRLVELGRIRLGEKGERGEPRKRTTFRLTSASARHLESVATIYGGTVRPWKGAPDEGYFELATTSTELDILIPPTLAAYSQSYELWQGGTCERRCDGVREQISGGPCLCDPNARTCQVTTRVSVMLPKVPGLGVWRLDTKGWNAATTLPATLELLGAMAHGGWVPAVLRMEQRSKKVRDAATRSVQTRRFVVPVIDIVDTPIGEIVTGEATPAARLAAAPTNRRERVPRPELPAGPELPEAAAFSIDQTRPADPSTTEQADQTEGGADAEPSAPPLDLSVECGAMPHDGNPLGLSLPCVLRGSHKVHRSAEGTWKA